MKAFVEERGSDRVRQVLGGGEPITTSRLTYIECCSTFARLDRDGIIARRDASRAVRELRNRWADIVVVELDDLVMHKASQLVQQHGLRGADSVHLASALVFSADAPDEVAFACWDRRMHSAAATIGLRVIPEALP